MSFGATLTITINAVAKVLSRINQDSYGSEWLLSSATEEIRLFIRHSKEAAKAGQVQMYRHNVDYTHTTFGTGGAPDNVRQYYTVFRVPYNDDHTVAQLDMKGYTYYVNGDTFQADLLNWLT